MRKNTVCRNLMKENSGNGYKPHTGVRIQLYNPFLYQGVRNCIYPFTLPAVSPETKYF